MNPIHAENSSGNLVLAGFMGTGKSAIGRILAEITGLEFYDLDCIVEQRAGRSIPEIFAAEGEAGFRRRESEAVAEIVDRRGFVLALGGGTLLCEANFAALDSAGIMVCLTAHPETIAARLRNDTTRPLLQAGDRVERLRQLLDERGKIYARIPRRVCTDGRSPTEVAAEVARIWKEETKTRRNPCKKR